MNQNTLTLKIKGTGAGRGGRVWRNQGWIRNNSSDKFADPWLSDTLRKANMEISDKMLTDSTNNHYIATSSEELVISPAIFKEITDKNTRLPRSVVRKESSVSLTTQIERSMNEFDLMLNMFEEDFEEPSKYFKSSHENVTDSAKLGLRLALTRYATKNAEIRNLSGKTMMAEDFEKIDTQTGEEEGSYVNLNEEISSFPHSERKIESTVLNSESGYTTTNESSGSEASNSLNSANSSYSSNSKNVLLQPINNLLTYHSVNDLTTNYTFLQTKTHNTSVMRDIDCDNITPLLLPFESTKGVYADPKNMVGDSAVTADIPPPSGFDYEAILRKKKPKTQKNNHEGFNIDEMKQLNEIFTTEKTATDNTIQSFTYNTSISKGVVKRKKRLEMDEMSISDTATNIQNLVYGELENSEKNSPMVSSYDNISSNTSFEKEYDDDTITNKKNSLNFPPEPDFIPPPPPLPIFFPIPSETVSKPPLSSTQNTINIDDDDYDYCIEEPFSEQQDTYINTIPLPPPLPCLLPPSSNQSSFVQPDSNTSSCLPSFSLTDLTNVHLRHSPDQDFPHNAKDDRNRLTDNNVVEAITNSITSGVFKLKATSKGSLIRKGIDFKRDRDNNENNSDVLKNERSYDTRINDIEANSDVTIYNRKISLENVDLDEKNENKIVIDNTGSDHESIGTLKNKNINVKEYKSNINIDYNVGNQGFSINSQNLNLNEENSNQNSKKNNIDIKMRKTPPEVLPKPFSSSLQNNILSKNNIQQNNRMTTKSNNSDKKTFEDIDISSITGYQKAHANLPEWRQALIEKKNKLLLEKYMQSLQKEDEWNQIPDWKKNLIKEKKKNF